MVEKNIEAVKLMNNGDIYNAMKVLKENYNEGQWHEWYDDDYGYACYLMAKCHFAVYEYETALFYLSDAKRYYDNEKSNNLEKKIMIKLKGKR